MAMSDLVQFKRRRGISPKHASCHAGRIAGYTIERHVPAREIARLLKEKPDVVALSVPGMQIGSPAMGVGNRREANSAILIRKDGTSKQLVAYTAIE